MSDVFASSSAMTGQGVCLGVGAQLTNDAFPDPQDDDDKIRKHYTKFVTRLKGLYQDPHVFLCLGTPPRALFPFPRPLSPSRRTLSRASHISAHACSSNT